ncbi:MAG: zinc ribbon domain-containing protein [Candidatus Binatia bacterium]
MAGITSYGVYIPRLRLPLAAIGGGAPKPGGPEKAVANWDEDSITMGVAAAIECIKGVERASVDAVLFASTTYPFKEKQGAAIVAKALDLRRDVYTADLGDSLRAGTSALRTGLDAIKAGSAKRVLVVVSDTRMAAPRSTVEGNLGDAAAAFLLGDGEVVAEIQAVHSVSDEIIDVWRTEGDPFVHAWEDRFVVDHGYRTSVREVVTGLLAKAGVGPKDVTKAAIYGPDARAHATVVRELGLDAKTQVEDALFGKVGSAGTALAPLLLASALEQAKAGEKLLVVAYGDGADALLLETTPLAARLEGRHGVGWHLARRAELKSYDTYLRFRQLIATEHDRRAGAGLSATKHFRDRDEDLTLIGQMCRRCGQAQFPRQRVCYHCFARDEFDKVRLSDKVGVVRSFTFDNFAGSPTPPLVAGIVEIEGARLYLQMTDVDAKEVKLQMPVELTFRKIHEAGGTPNYFWKSTPVR